jgi:hypothetical protein
MCSPGGTIATSTDTERAATYGSFIAGAGSYTFDGSTLALKADFRKNPNERTATSGAFRRSFKGTDCSFYSSTLRSCQGANTEWSLCALSEGALRKPRQAVKLAPRRAGDE